MRVEKRGDRSKNEVKISSRVFTYLCLAGLSIAVVAGWLVFVKGFFPLRARAGDGGETRRGVGANDISKDVPDARFDKLIFIVFDAMRSDFITDPSSQVCESFHVSFSLFSFSSA